MTNGFMTVPELAEYLNLDLHTLWRLLRVHPLAGKDAQLPGVRIEGRWRFRKEDIDRWLRQQVQLRDDGRRQPWVLVVDDDVNFRSMLLDYLLVSGYIARAAESGEAALALLREMSFELLLVDLQMPGMSGLELIRHATRLHPDGRIIVVTGYGSKEAVVEALGPAVSDCLEKPILDLRVVESAIEMALGHHVGAAGPMTESPTSPPAVAEEKRSGASRNGPGLNHRDHKSASEDRSVRVREEWLDESYVQHSQKEVSYVNSQIDGVSAHSR
ncbi:MAG: response regulator [Candidatus Methylomirabilaceae bacterium]